MMHTSLSPPASFHVLDPDVLSTVNASCPNLHAAITSFLQFLSCFFFFFRFFQKLLPLRWRKNTYDIREQVRAETG